MGAKIIFKNAYSLEGKSIGDVRSVAGELVFTTGMVGYAESLTDPSYAGQILVFTYPLIGNYGVFGDEKEKNNISKFFESSKIHAKGVIVSEACLTYSHHRAISDFDSWLKKNNTPGLCDIDTRALTLRISNHGSPLAKIQQDDTEIDFFDPNQQNMVAEVSVKAPKFYDQQAKKTVVVIDNGVKNGILRSLVSRKVNFHLVPWDYDYTSLKYDGILISNGPGDPNFLEPAIEILKSQLKADKPIMGICMGHQLLAMAAGAKIYKMKFGHRSQNQPCIKVGTQKIYITSQNHGYAIEESTLNKDWLPWFFNANDGSNEGIKHKKKPFFSVQFHPEATPGPTDTNFMFDDFIKLL